MKTEVTQPGHSETLSGLPDHASELLHAMAAACTLLAIADGHIAESERKKFLSCVADQPVLRPFGYETIAGLFAFHEAELKKNPSRGMREAFALIKPLAARPGDAKAVVEACWAVLSADGFARRPEFHALDAIRRALGLIPADPSPLLARGQPVRVKARSEPEIIPPGHHVQPSHRLPQ